MEIGQPYNPRKLFYGIFIPEWLLERTEISQGAKLSFGVLGRSADEEGATALDGQSIGRQVGTSDRQARTYLRELEEQGLIVVQQRGLGLPNLYRFLWHPWADASGIRASVQEWNKASVQERTYSSVPSLSQSTVTEEMNSTRAREAEPSSSSSPSEMPDGTQRLTDGQFEALDGLRRDFTDALVLSSAVQVKFRRLLADGASLALIDEMVREAALSQRRKNGVKWRASRLDYFEPAVRRRLDELRHDAAVTAPLAATRPPPDPEQRSIRRAALLRAATRGQEGDFSEACEAFGAWLEGLGWEPADAGREVAVLVAEVRAEARSLRGSENGRLAEGDRRPGPADAEPAHSGG